MTANSIVSNITGWPGRQLIQALMYVIDLVTFSLITIADWFGGSRKPRINSNITMMHYNK